ncbi:hypothetical protein B0J14DRAFT_558233 [Halenospora varia]|nr:hypothetical protein B0J14DRAFT_558233 [Halenospora varia]
MQPDSHQELWTSQQPRMEYPSFSHSCTSRGVEDGGFTRACVHSAQFRHAPIDYGPHSQSIPHSLIADIGVTGTLNTWPSISNSYDPHGLSLGEHVFRDVGHQASPVTAPLRPAFPAHVYGDSVTHTFETNLHHGFNITEQTFSPHTYGLPSPIAFNALNGIYPSNEGHGFATDSPVKAQAVTDISYPGLNQFDFLSTFQANNTATAGNQYGLTVLNSGQSQIMAGDNNFQAPTMAVNNVFPTVTPSQLGGQRMALPGRFACTLCPKTYKLDKDCKRHEKKHRLAVTPILCQIPGCAKGQGIGYTRKDKLTEHMWKAHRDVGFTKRVM